MKDSNFLKDLRSSVKSSRSQINMALANLDCNDVSEAAADAFGSIAMNGDQYVKCGRCGFGGCDVRVAGCGCTLHGVSNFAIFIFQFCFVFLEHVMSTKIA